MYDSNIKQDTGGEFVSEGMFFPEQPCYHIEILEWIDKEDITDEWRYVWMYDHQSRSIRSHWEALLSL